MISENQIFEVISDYQGIGEFLCVKKRDIVNVIKKELVWFTVEKDGLIGKVPAGKLRK
ncbi:MAG: hypothetical protein EZS28_038866, partial [Streblomastix strix]